MRDRPRRPAERTVIGADRPYPSWALRVVLADGTGSTLRSSNTVARLVGSDPECDLSLADAALLPQHLRLVPAGDGIELQPKGPTRVNGRALKGPLRLCDGDRIDIGSTTITFEGPRGGGFPVSRIGETYWCLTAENSGWQAVAGTGLARNAAGMFENISLVDDNLGSWSNLKSYVEQQRRMLAKIHQDFEATLFDGKEHFSCSERLYLESRFTFLGKQTAQLQFYGLKHGEVAVATWTPPPGTMDRADRFASFDQLLSLVHFH